MWTGGKRHVSISLSFPHLSIFRSNLLMLQHRTGGHGKKNSTQSRKVSGSFRIQINRRNFLREDSLHDVSGGATIVFTVKKPGLVSICGSTTRYGSTRVEAGESAFTSEVHLEIR
ncbi:hypothetical protein ElyMa_007027600 [Elysia marginata]|uniref:Uncharacterized protein n=1 Tax=Elysia marginata TaxID=1093978 RepID=A0AAV4JRS1_9GAST|nr:hypothetical protein ElyMa_007027600 [Elysia marginata]